jgi:DUF4097 and DUF4098 domain-containing protein YvlB
MHKTFDVSGPMQLDLRVASGEIEIDATLEGRVEVELTGHDEESQRLVDASTVELRETSGRQEVVVDVPNRQGTFGFSMIFGRQGVSCRVRCPQGSLVKARTKSADVSARGELGAADIATASGEVELGNVAGDLTAKTASGEIAARSVAGRVSINTASGDISIDEVHGAVSSNSASGDTRIGFARGDVKLNSASGDQRLEAVVAGQVSVNSASGDVEVGVRRGSRVYLDCTTVSGDARSELDVSSDGEPAGNEPFVEIRARTVSGDIRITRAQEVHA